MPRRGPKRDHWLNRPHWKLQLGEWIGLTLAILGIAAVFGLFFIRRHTLDFRLSHSFTVQAPEFFGSALALSNPVPIGGNSIDILENGEAFFPAMLEAIQGAKKTVNFEAYIFHSDEVGRRFRDAFIAAAQRGVEVRLLLDGVGSSWSLDNSDVRALRRAGVKLYYYHPTQSWRVDRTNRRTHRRVLVVDGRVGFSGAVGFAEQWDGHAQDPKHWHDIQVRVTGPMVSELQAAFQQHWVKTGAEALTGADQFPALTPAGNLRGQVVQSYSFSMAPVPLVKAVAFTAATRRIWITNSYCTPTVDQVRALTEAAQRGVDVRLLVPGEHNDQPLTKSAGRTAYGDLLKGGVKIFEYTPTMIHIKGIVVDSLFSLIGSSNFDSRSAEINEELDLAIYDADFSRRMEEMFERDLAKSREYTLEQFQHRSLIERCTEWLAVPFRSQL